MKSTLDLLESRKFIMTVIILNVILFVFLAGYVILHVVKTNREQIDQVQGGRRSEQWTRQAQLDGKDGTEEELENIYEQLLEGLDFEPEEGISFHFGENREFSGYFDKDNTKVNGFFYEVIVDGADIMLNLFDKENTKRVSYSLYILNDGNLEISQKDGQKYSLFIE